MDEQPRLLVDAVERILSEPFTVRELVILSPYARERSAAGQALADPTTDDRLTSRLGTGIEDSTRIRWGSIHEFKGLEAPEVILTDVDLSKGYHRDVLYVGVSRGTDRLVVRESRACSVGSAELAPWTPSKPLPPKHSTKS